MNKKNFAVPVKFWALFCSILGINLTSNYLLTCVLALTGFCYLGAQRNYKFLISSVVFYGVLALLLYLIRFHSLHMLFFSEFYVVLFWNIFPVCIVGWDILTTPPGELSAFFSKIKMPPAFILGLLVMFRFFPTMKTELKNVKLSMKNRGLTAPGQIFRHPINTCEYVLVPCMLRCLQIADQLSVSAVARGAECPGNRGSYYGRKINIADIICFIVWTVVTISFLLVGGIRF